MHLPACFALLMAGYYSNAGDRRALLLLLLVGLTVFTPTPREWTNFYVFCISAEMIVALLALRLKTAASVPVALVCVLLVIVHLMGYYKNGYPAHSPYRVIVPALEILEILCCILASKRVAQFLLNRE